MIDLAPGNISIRANRVNTLEILDGIAAQAGFRLLAGDIAWETVTVDIQKDTLHAALVELIKAYPYLIVYTPDKDTRREVLSEVVVGDLLATATADSDAATAAGDEAPLENPDDLPDPEQQAYLEELQSPFPEVRARAVKEIEPVGEALYVLTDLIVNDPSSEVRIATTRALEFSEDPLAIQALAACLKDEDLYVVLECITTLEHIGDATSVVHLQPLLMHYDETVRNTSSIPSSSAPYHFSIHYSIHPYFYRRITTKLKHLAGSCAMHRWSGREILFWCARRTLPGAG